MNIDLTDIPKAYTIEELREMMVVEFHKIAEMASNVIDNATTVEERQTLDEMYKYMTVPYYMAMNPAAFNMNKIQESYIKSAHIDNVCKEGKLLFNSLKLYYPNAVETTTNVGKIIRLI